MTPAQQFQDLLAASGLTILWFLAVARVTRLITMDRLSEPFRVWLIRRNGGDDSAMVPYLFQCPWCMSMWVGLASAPLLLWIAGYTMWLAPLFGFAASWFTGISAVNWEGDEDDIIIDEDEEQ